MSKVNLLAGPADRNFVKSAWLPYETRRGAHVKAAKYERNVGQTPDLEGIGVDLNERIMSFLGIEEETMLVSKQFYLLDQNHAYYRRNLQKNIPGSPKFRYWAFPALRIPQTLFHDKPWQTYARHRGIQEIIQRFDTDNHDKRLAILLGSRPFLDAEDFYKTFKKVGGIYSYLRNIACEMFDKEVSVRWQGLMYNTFKDLTNRPAGMTDMDYESRLLVLMHIATSPESLASVAGGELDIADFQEPLTNLKLGRRVVVSRFHYVRRWTLEIHLKMAQYALKDPDFDWVAYLLNMSLYTRAADLLQSIAKLSDNSSTTNMEQKEEEEEENNDAKCSIL